MGRQALNTQNNTNEGVFINMPVCVNVFMLENILYFYTFLYSVSLLLIDERGEDFFFILS